MAVDLTAGATLWAQELDQPEQTLPLWQALLIAAALELLVPLLLFGVDWSFLPDWPNPPPIPVMSVRLEPAPPPEPPPPEQIERKTLPKPKKLKQVPLEPPKPFPDEVPAKMALPKPEPEPKPQPKEEPEPEPPPEPKPEPEPEAPPLPSVFRDIKPVKKVKPKYPPEAEAQHIQGRVKVRLSVEVDGSVSAVEVLLSEPSGVFDEAVLEAVRQYRFKRDGTTYQADQEILFKLDE